MSKCLLQQWKVVQVLVPLINEFVCFVFFRKRILHATGQFGKTLYNIVQHSH